MNKYKLPSLLSLCLIIACCACAQDTARENKTYNPASPTQSLSDQPAQPIPVEAVQVEPVLDPRLFEIETQFRSRLDVLETAITAAKNPAEEMELQKEAERLKIEWTLALNEVMLQIAREKGDTEAEAQALQLKDNIQNPPAHPANPVLRDPDTGKLLEGGAR